MNIQSFSMISAAYSNPSAYGDLTGWNYVVWYGSHLFAQQKFLNIFSILFGAGIILITNRLEKKEGSAKEGSVLMIYSRRHFYLLLIGFIHAYLIWHGDILVSYGICAFLLYAIRKWQALPLVVVAAIFWSIGTLLFTALGLTIEQVPAETLTELQQDWRPDYAKVQEELTIFRSGYFEQLPHRVNVAFKMQTFLFLLFSVWHIGGMMLLGMALYKWGVLSARRSKRFYIILGSLCALIGFPLIVYGIHQNFLHAWSVNYSLFLGNLFNDFGSIFVSLFYICTIMLLVKSGRLKRLQTSLAATGRMALSNYLFQSIFCTFLFYGHGLGLFGYVARTEQLAIVLGVWLIQIAFSNWWLRRYTFGPMEWLWRRLTYGKKQTMEEVN